MWKLVGSPAALSAFPGWFAFSVPGAVAGTDRLCCLLVSGRGSFRRRVVDTRRVRCAVTDVREEVPGQRITWQLRSTEPAGKQVFTLSARPEAGRSAVRIAVTTVTARSLAADREPYWRRHVRTWLRCLRDVAEGRTPWPQAEMPAEMQRALTIPPALRNPAQASAAVVINAAPGDVWEAVRDPASPPPDDPERIAWSGLIPGTPRQQAGEMDCHVLRHPGGRFTASVHMVTDLADGHREVVRHVGTPEYETVAVITPVPGGTRLELTFRWPPREMRGHAIPPDMPEKMHAAMKRTAEGYRALLERVPGSRTADQASGGTGIPHSPGSSA